VDQCLCTSHCNRKVTSVNAVYNNYDSLSLKATIYPVSATPNRIAVVARPHGWDWLGDEIRSLSQEGINVLVSMLTNEEGEDLGLHDESRECSAAGITFANIAVPDRSVPADKKGFLITVERLAELIKQGRYIGVHCRASIGRSSMLVASVLIRVGWDAEAAFEAIESARGCIVPDTPEQKQWVISNVPSLR